MAKNQSLLMLLLPWRHQPPAPWTSLNNSFMAFSHLPVTTLATRTTNKSLRLVGGLSSPSLNDASHQHYEQVVFPVCKNRWQQWFAVESFLFTVFTTTSWWLNARWHKLILFFLYNLKPSACVLPYRSSTYCPQVLKLHCLHHWSTSSTQTICNSDYTGADW